MRILGWIVKLIMAVVMVLAITLVFNAAAKVLGLESALAMLLLLVIMVCIARWRRR